MGFPGVVLCLGTAGSCWVAELEHPPPCRPAALGTAGQPWQASTAARGLTCHQLLLAAAGLRSVSPTPQWVQPRCRSAPGSDAAAEAARAAGLSGAEQTPRAGHVPVPASAGAALGQLQPPAPGLRLGQLFAVFELCIPPVPGQCSEGPVQDGPLH